MGLTRAFSTGSLTSALSSGSLTSSLSTASLSAALYEKGLRLSKNIPGNSNLPGAKSALDDTFVMQEETGAWRYLVIDPKGIRARDDPSYSKNTKNAELSRYTEGTVIEVDRRRRVGWTCWLGLKSGEGWLFDVSPKDKKVRMVQVEVMSGQWMYEACMFQRVPVLPRPTLSTSSSLKLPKKASSAPTLELREVVSVTERVRPVSGKGTFLRLADGRGWVLDFADGHRVLQRWKYPAAGGGMVVAEDSSNGSSSPTDQQNRTGPAAEGDAECLNGSMEPTELGPPELGSWDYVVLDPRGLSLRGRPTYDPSHKIARRVEEGEIVEVKERRAGDGTTFLRLACPQGWVFDQQPGKDSRLRMMQVEIERGSWHYMVVAPAGVALRTRCSFSDDTKCGQGPLKGAVFECSARVKVGETTFLQIKEGGRWVFDRKGGRKILEHVVMQVQPEGTKASVKHYAGVQLLAAPTNQKWAAGKMRLLHNAQVQVNALFEHDFTRWAYVVKPGSGMQGWMFLDDLTMEDAETSPAAAASSLRNVGSSQTISGSPSTLNQWRHGQAWNHPPPAQIPV
mmetsp:Transcript_10596/g.19591  ORF Transcript_10596/g.19591 Transcript_10596/m.19591 type:complete len:566 (-) Transcript_10596:126-1823(-)